MHRNTLPLFWGISFEGFLPNINAWSRQTANKSEYNLMPCTETFFLGATIDGAHRWLLSRLFWRNAFETTEITDNRNTFS